MSIKEKLQADKISAMKSRDSVAVSSINAVLSEIEIAEKSGKSLDDTKVQGILKSVVAQRRKSIQAYNEALETSESRADDINSMLENLNAELTVLLGYLPKQWSDEEILSALTAEIASNDRIKSMLTSGNEKQATSAEGMLVGIVSKKAGAASDGGTIKGLVPEALKASGF